MRKLLKRFPMPAVGTFQGAGAISRELLPLFYGRVGLFRNQPGDKVLAKADVVITVGYDPVEYGPDAWNVAKRASIIHVDDYPCDIDNYYQPEIELHGSLEDTLDDLALQLNERPFTTDPELQPIQAEFHALRNPVALPAGQLVHPLNYVITLRSLVDDDTIVASDMGSHHIWNARHFFEFEPRRLLFSNGQQTLGVGIPWAMAGAIVYPGKKVVASVGDGGFLYSSMELETAVRLKLNLTVFVLRDGGYDMVAFQQRLLYGRVSGVKFGNPDLVKYAESMGAIGMRVDKPEALSTVMKKALETPGVVIVDVPVDYSRNVEIGQHVLPNAWD